MPDSFEAKFRCRTMAASAANAAVVPSPAVVQLVGGFQTSGSRHSSKLTSRPHWDMGKPSTRQDSRGVSGRLDSKMDSCAVVPPFLKGVLGVPMVDRVSLNRSFLGMVFGKSIRVIQCRVSNAFTSSGQVSSRWMMDQQMNIRTCYLLNLLEVIAAECKRFGICATMSATMCASQGARVVIQSFLGCLAQWRKRDLADGVHPSACPTGGALLSGPPLQQ